MRFLPKLFSCFVCPSICLLLTSLLPTSLLPTSLIAQSPLATTFASDNGGLAGGMIFFDLSVTNPAGITVKQLDINTLSAGGELHVYTGAFTYVNIAASPSAWTRVAKGTVVASGLDNPSRVCLGGGFFLPTGNHAIALWGRDVSHRYTGVGTPQLVYANADLSLIAGAATNTQFGGVQYSPRVWNGSVYYDVGQTLGFSCAYTESIGVGCGEGSTTWYEEFASLSAFDLAGTIAAPMTWLATAAGASGFVVLPSLPQWKLPSGAQLSDNNQASPGPLGLNEFSEPLALPFSFSFPGGSTNVVHASANGCILLGPTTSQVDFTVPSVNSLLAQAARICPLWCQLDPLANTSINSASGVYYEVDSSNQTAVITWLDVGDARLGPPAPGATSVNVQCVLFSSGSYEFRYGPVVPAAGPGAAIVGWSKGSVVAPIPDPGGSDLSAGGAVLTSGPDNLALEHTAGVARLGSNLLLSIDDVESVSPVAFLLVGDALSLPGVNLATVGAPDCFAYTNVLAAVSVPVNAATGSGLFTLPIPSNATLIGSEFISQYAALTQRNMLNVSTSNAARFVVGN
ncbi:MAG: hypothetical protein ACJAUC_001677 [Planctomycetota bacterium]|jgi:hypothetical protein